MALQFIFAMDLKATPFRPGDFTRARACVRVWTRPDSYLGSWAGWARSHLIFQAAAAWKTMNVRDAHRFDSNVTRAIENIRCFLPFGEWCRCEIIALSPWQSSSERCSRSVGDGRLPRLRWNAIRIRSWWKLWSSVVCACVTFRELYHFIDELKVICSSSICCTSSAHSKIHSGTP